MKKKIVSVIMAVAFFCAASALYAEEMACPHLGKKGKCCEGKERTEKLLKQLKLTVEQKAKVQEILSKSREEAQSVMTETKDKLKGIKERSNNEINALLSPEQQNKFAEIREKRECMLKRKGKESRSRK